jgi:small-conductance mechanosensitive channel
MFVIAFFGLLFKEFIVSTIQGLFVLFGNDINNDDMLYISGRQSRVVRVGFRKTIFYMTDRGTKMIVPNEKLSSLTIEKKLPKNGERLYIPKETEHIKNKAGLHQTGREVSVKD